MKLPLLPSICAGLLGWVCGTLAAPRGDRVLPLRLISYNIRYDNFGDGDKNEPRWETRMPLLAKQIADEDAESQDLLICLQEPRRHQLYELQQKLYNEADPNSWWDWSGWDRRHDREATPTDEYNAIFYQSETWHLDGLEEWTYWLNEGLEKNDFEDYSIGWDAQLPRILSIARFTHKKTGARVVWGCSQLEYQYKKGKTIEAPAKQAEWINRIADRWAEDGKYPVFIATDLNHEKGSEPYNKMNEGMTSIQDAIPSAKQGKTFTAFTDDEKDDEAIDYIWVKDEKMVNLVSFDILDNKVEGTYATDHRMVLANVEVPF